MQGPYRFALALSCLATSALASLTPARSYFESRRDARLPAIVSIQKHLAEVEHHLRTYPPAGLTAGQAAARAERLEDLRAYTRRGDFPRNLDFPDRVIPYFIDARGIACAVGHLMLLSGGGSLATEIARTRNQVYIPEVRDPRLAEWARNNGLTLEECAWIQPSYAAHYGDIIDLDFDGGNRPWVATGNGVSIGGYVLSRLGTEGWAPHSANPAVSYRDFCMVGDKPLMVHYAGLSWNGGATSHAEVGAMDMQGSHCAAMPDGAGFWVGGKSGLWKFTVDGEGAPVLSEKVRAGAGALPGDTVVGIAAAGDRLWAATSRGVAYRKGSGAWSLGMEYADMSGRYPGGLEADGAKGAWIGTRITTWISQDDRVSTPFSEKGLARMDSNGQVTWYHMDNSPLPDNGIHRAAGAKDGGVWLTTNGGKIMHFLPPDRLTVLPAVLTLSINALEVDREGRLHVGTYGGAMATAPTRGLYRLEGDSLVWIGHPSPSSSIARKEGRHPGRAAGWRDLLGPGGDGLSRLDMLGRRFRLSD